MKFTPEFKKAISQLPPQEKDKLILRLLKHDLILANQLYFQLLDNESVQVKRQKAEINIIKRVENMTTHFYSPGYLLVDLRYLSGDITEHVKITKDKYGEASLNLLMLNEVLKRNNENILKFSPAKCSTLSTYIIARAYKILILIKAMHKDYLIEFEDGLKELGQLISKNSLLMKTAIANMFDVNWLLQASIPDDIVVLHKEIRAKGYLK